MAACTDTLTNISSCPTIKTDGTLNSKWMMSYRDQNIKRESISSENYKSDLEGLLTCATVEEFWVMLDNLQLPGRLNRRNNSSYMFFREGVTPTWEDKQNQNGGMWRIVLKRNDDRVKYLDTFWIEILLALVGEQIRHSMEITGVVVKRRQREDRIELWTKGRLDEELNHEIQMEIGTDLKDLLGILDELEYTKHDTVKQMDQVRRAGNRDNSLTRKGSITRQASLGDVFKTYKNTSFECRFEDRSSYRI